MPRGKDICGRRIHPNETYAVSIWGTADVIDRAKMRGIKLSKSKAEDILDQVDRRQDASIGINWDVLDDYIDDYRPKRR